jgi:hypothetical protein
MTYVNHEGVPETDAVEDYFTEVTLFRRHYFSVRGRENEEGMLPLGKPATSQPVLFSLAFLPQLPISREVQASMRYWRERTGQVRDPPCF